MNYDHHTKAGNPGDVVKHVALTAALRGVLSTEKAGTSAFVYADTFAAYVQNPVLNRHRRQWGPGIGQVLKRDVRDALRSDPAATSWMERYLPEARASLHGGMYPGSCLVAYDEIVAHGRTPKLRLWDIAPKAVEDLRIFFTEEDGHVVLHESASHQGALSEWGEDANFVFVDPPGHDDPKGEYPTADELAVYFDLPVMMMWLPLVGRIEEGRVAGEHQKCGAIRTRAEQKGLSSVTVKTGDAEKHLGCRLLMRLPAEAEASVRNAVAVVCRAYAWTYEFRAQAGKSAGAPDA